MNRQQYERLLQFAGKVEEFAVEVTKAGEDAKDLTGKAAVWLENYAQRLRTEAERQRPGVWEETTDQPEPNIDPNLLSDETLRALADRLLRGYKNKDRKGF